MCAFQMTGNVTGEPADELFMIFNASETSQKVALPNGIWQVCIDDKTAGTDAISSVKKEVCVAPISAMVLVKGNLT